MAFTLIKSQFYEQLNLFDPKYSASDRIEWLRETDSVLSMADWQSYT